MMHRVIQALEAMLAIPMLVYCGVLFVRVMNGGVGRVGGDVITLGYLFATSSLVLTFTAPFLGRRKSPSHLSRFAHIVTATAIACWLGLHLGGVVHSHASLFDGRA
nr:hypothetical protein [uncultured Rhodoferax sp.]